MRTVQQTKPQAAFMRVYTALLRLYPSSYRVRFETELVQLAHTSLLHDGPQKGVFPTIRWQLAWLADLVISALHEQRREWEKNMNKKNLISIFGSLLMIAWITFVSLSVAKDLFHLPYKEPMLWLIGEMPSNPVFMAANGFVVLAPFLALLITGLPYLKVVRGSQENQVAEIHLLKAGGLSRIVIAISGVLSCLLLMIILFGRML